MDNRGSKSVLNIYNTVKEQRADGTGFFLIISLVKSKVCSKSLWKKVWSDVKLINWFY